MVVTAPVTAACAQAGDGDTDSAGTTVVQDADDFDPYVVTLRDGTALVATSSGGDEFTADGVVDDSEPVVDPTEPQSVVGSVLDFCGLDAAPILFPDADTFTTPR